MKLQFLVYLYYKVVTAFKNGFTERIGKTVINLAFLEVLCSLGVQKFRSLSDLKILNLFFRKDILSDATLTTGSIAIVCIGIFVVNIIQNNCTIPCNIFNSSVAIVLWQYRTFKWVDSITYVIGHPLDKKWDFFNKVFI